MMDRLDSDEIIDLDHDGLDDRLIQEKIGENDTVHDVMRRLDMLQLHMLPVHMLDRMLGNVEHKKTELWQRARTIESSVHEDLLHGNYSALEKMRRKLRMLDKEYENLSDQYIRLYNVRQNCILRDNLERKLGPRVHKIVENVILLLIFMVLSLLCYDLLTERSPEHLLNSWTIFYIDSACCLVFLTDFFFRLSQAEDRKWFWKTYWIDFITSIPVPPASTGALLRFGLMGRLVRFIRVLRLFRLLRLVPFIWRGFDKLNDMFDVRMMKKSFKWGASITVVGALLIFKLEGEGTDHTGIENIALSFWWAFTTVVTGGFGDIYNPNSFWGQFLTGLLVVSGMILIGVFTATLTSLYVGEETDELNQISDDIAKQIVALKLEVLERLDEQDQRIAELRGDRDS